MNTIYFEALTPENIARAADMIERLSRHRDGEKSVPSENCSLKITLLKS